MSGETSRTAGDSDANEAEGGSDQTGKASNSRYSSLASDERLITLTIVIASFMCALDITIVNISLPTIAHYFGSGVTIVSWVVVIYLLVMASFIIAFGKLGDVLGYRKVFLAGYLLFVLGSLGSGLSPTIHILILSRSVQAVGSAMLTSLISAMVSSFLPAKSRGRVLGYVMTFSSLGVAAGPFTGGYLTDLYSWRFIFFINVPIGILAFLLGRMSLPKTEHARPGSRFRAWEALIAFGALFSFLYGLNMGNDLSWYSATVLGSFLIAAIFMTAFVYIEGRIEDPLVDFSLFHNRSFAAANFAGLLISMCLAGAFFILPFYLELLKGFSVDKSGILLTAPSIAMIVFGPMAGAVSDKIGGRRICIAACLLSLISFVIYAGFNSRTSEFEILIGLLLFGASIGAFFPPNTSLIMGHSPNDKLGMASSLVQTLRTLGETVGVAVFQGLAVMTLHLPKGESTAPTVHIAPEAIEFAVYHVFSFGFLVCAAAVLLSVVSHDAVIEELQQEKA